jgi:hypothetical protein
MPGKERELILTSLRTAFTRDMFTGCRGCHLTINSVGTKQAWEVEREAYQSTPSN